MAVSVTEGNNILGLLRAVIVKIQITKLALNKQVCLHGVPIRILEQSDCVCMVLPLG